MTIGHRRIAFIAAISIGGWLSGCGASDTASGPSNVSTQGGVDSRPSVGPSTAGGAAMAGGIGAANPLPTTGATGNTSGAGGVGGASQPQSSGAINGSGGHTGGVGGREVGAGGRGGSEVPSSGGGPIAVKPMGGTGGAVVVGQGGTLAGGWAGSGALPAITMWVAGDSTVANGSTPCPVGWAKQFSPYLDNRVTIVNRAIGGRSVVNWLYSVQATMGSDGECLIDKDTSGQPVIQAGWKEMLAGMKAGDYLFIQFGINDGSTTCNRHVGLAAFKKAYGMMAAAAKDRGTQPVFLTPVSAISCTGSTAKGTRGGFVTATQEAGKEYDVPVIDLHELSVALYSSLGFCPVPGGDVSATTSGPVGDFFCDDHTHFSTTGATRIAGLVANAIRTQGLGLSAYLAKETQSP